MIVSPSKMTQGNGLKCVVSPSGKIKKQWLLVDSGITRREASVKGWISSSLCLVYVEKLPSRKIAQDRASMFKLRSLPALTSTFLTFTSWKLPGLCVTVHPYLLLSDNVYSPVIVLPCQYSNWNYPAPARERITKHRTEPTLRDYTCTQTWGSWCFGEHGEGTSSF